MQLIQLNQDKVITLNRQEYEAAGLTYELVKSCMKRSARSKVTINGVACDYYQHQRLTVIDNPTDLRAKLLIYESLADDLQKKVKEKFGNPYEHMAIDQIRSMIAHDDQAEAFYTNYRYGNNQSLSTAHITRYTRQAEFLNMLKALLDDKRMLKEKLNLSIEQFFDRCIKLIQLDRLGLPESYRRLVVNEDSALKKYKREGYQALISWKLGNKLAAKVKDELAEGTLLEMIAHNLQFDDVLIADQYNKWAKENNYKPIEPATVGHWRRKREEDIIIEREGNAAFNRKYNRSIKGFRPTEPLRMVESDDNHIDLLFLDLDDPTQHKYYHKHKAIVVTDSFNDLPLGFASAEKLSVEVVYAAYMDAMYYVKQLTGGWHLFGEVKTDRWALKELESFYRSLGKFAETPAGSKNRGYIEQFFGSAHWKRALKISAMGVNNYSGNNMTAKYRGVNTEVLDRSRKDYPTVQGESYQQLAAFVHRLRHMPTRSGQSKEQQWLAAWQTATKKRPITDEQFLLKFGIEHNFRGDGYTITNKGLQPMINGVRYNYDLAQYRVEDIGLRVSILYDPYDMSRVLVTDHKGFRMMAYDARLTARAMDDARIDSRVYLNQLLEQKRNNVEQYTERSERRKQVLNSAGVSVEAIMQAGTLTKELRQAAEVRMLPNGPAEIETENYFDLM